MTQLACVDGGIKLSGNLIEIATLRPAGLRNNFRVELLVMPHQRYVTVEAIWPERTLDLASGGKGNPLRLNPRVAPGSGDPVRIVVDTEPSKASGSP